jgi:hypothetical protein
MFNKIFNFSVLAFFLPLVLVLSIKEGSFSFNFFYIYFLLVSVCFRIFYTGLYGQKKLSLLFFYVFVYVFLCVQPMLSIWVGDFPHGNTYMTTEIIFYTITLVITGILSFEFSYNLIKYFLKQKSKTNKLKIVNNVIFFLNRSYFSLIIVIIIFLISIPVYGPYMFLGIRDGGLDLGESRGIERSTIVDLLLVYGLRTFSAIILFKLLIMKKNNKLTENKKKYDYLLFFCILVNLIISNPLNAPRLWSGGILLTSFFIFTNWGRQSFSKIYFYTSLILLLLFSGLDPRIIVGRQLMNENEITVSGTFSEITGSFKRLPVDYNFDSFQVISFTKIYSEKNGFSYGRQLLLPLFFWVPRTLWPNKPIGTSDMVAASFDLPNLNISAPLWTEGYVNFGIFGILFFFILLGILSYHCDTILIKGDGSNAQIIMASFFSANMIILLRGDLTTGTQYLQTMMLFIFIANKMFFNKFKS